MAYVSTHSHTVLDRIASGLRAVGEFTVLLFTAQSRVQAIEWLLRQSDDDLVARGTTRQIELQRILGVRAAL